MQQLEEASIQQMADMFDMTGSGRNSTMQILLDAGRLQGNKFTLICVFSDVCLRQCQCASAWLGRLWGSGHGWMDEDAT